MPRSLPWIAAFASLFGLAHIPGGVAQAAVGGPDSGGYVFADQVDGATFNYIDIRATGTLLVSADDSTAITPLGAPITIYGDVHASLGVSTNGFVSDAVTLAADFSNDCPLPTLPSVGAGSFRVAALHDDLVTDVYYQYFDEIQAAAIGYPGQVAGISVFQWFGRHFAGPPNTVDAELVLFHDDDAMLAMVALDSESGSGSTMGIQNMDASTGLNYGCNQGGFVDPGVTAVQYTPGSLPDSDCCTASPTGLPGCTTGGCQAAVCATDPACCTTAWDQVCADTAAASCVLLCGGPPPPLTINEIRVNQNGPDNDEYFEIVGPPGTVLADVQYIVLGDFPTGEVEAVVDLSGLVIPPSAFLVVAQASFSLGVADFVTPLAFENTDTVTHMLVGGFSGSLSDNLDPNNDGVLDVTPWILVFDALSIIEPGGEELPYATAPNCVPGATCQEIGAPGFTPNHVYRCPNVSGAWQVGNNSVVVPPILDTPGAGNACNGCGNGIVEFDEDCDDGVATATCDDDCTLAECGDGVLNPAAGEACDDAGESATCDVDCTPPSCGDGVFNAAAGEACDDGGPSAVCDADCTFAMCGDGVLNPAAGEACDDGGESAMCDADCTPAECGDGVTNPVAGETCDDGGRSVTCDADCTTTECGDGQFNPTAGEECDGDGQGQAGPTDTCDADCTLAMCGDGVINMLAGEACDAAGESETCDDDCTEAMCGDGSVNMTAGEECDDGGPSDTCDEDCTAAMCGDGSLNAAAGEECDDGGRSASCDDDCTAAMCGDGTLNDAAGEECDDGNTDGDDGCAADCTLEDDPGTTGGADTTAGDATGDGGSAEGATPSTGLMESTSGAPSGSTGSAGGGGSGQMALDDDGCGCSSRPSPAQWSSLMLLALGLRTRRRRSRPDAR